MNVLILGGTVFLGRAVAAEALALGADVTVFNRGRSGPAPAGTTQVTGDRTVAADLVQLAGRPFDVVVDTSGYVPADVALSANLLAPTCGHYAFISSINAWPGWPEQPDYRDGGAHRGNADATRDDLPAETSAAQAYGWLKVGCELAVSRAFGADRSSALRAGAIVGPNDSQVGRLPWWIDRVARGGDVLVPGRPDDPIALIDTRDLARFALSGAPGTFDAPGPANGDTRADLMAACVAATGSDATFTYVDSDWLDEQGVEFWTELPLWIPASKGPSVFASLSAEAAAAGLSWRPLSETVADTWTWQRTLPGGWAANERTPGLAADREAELLAAWSAR